VYFTHDDNREGFYGHINTYYDPNLGGRPVPLPANLDAWGTGPGNDVQGYRSPYAPSTIGEVGYIGHLYRDFTVPTFRLDWTLPSGATVTSITGFSNLYFDYDESCSGAPQLTCQDPFHQSLQQWSEELRISNTTTQMSWVAGLYGLYVYQQDKGAFYSPFYSGTPFAFGSYANFSQKLVTGAAFGQVEYLLSPHWRATLGVRVGHDKKDFSSQTFFTEVGDLVSQYVAYNPPLLVADFSPATVGGLATQSETDWSGKAQMDYIWNRNVLLYASINRGVKGAGFNSNNSGALTNESIPFGPEHVLEYEVGEKITALDNHLRVNGAAFYYDYHNYQAYQLLTGVSPYTSNNKARFEGAEVELQVVPFKGLEFQLGVTGLSTKVFGVHTAQIGVVDQQSTDAPKWSGNALVRYSWPVGEGTLSAVWSSDYVGDRYHSVDNTPSVLVHSSWGHNASLSYLLKHWEVSAGVSNLTNNVRQTAAYDLTSYGYAIQTYMPPRWWNVSLRYQY
jgi:iron complex outermembrane receptor protein